MSAIETCIAFLSYDENDLVKEARNELAQLRAKVAELERSLLTLTHTENRETCMHPDCVERRKLRAELHAEREKYEELKESAVTRINSLSKQLEMELDWRKDASVGLTAALARGKKMREYLKEAIKEVEEYAIIWNAEHKRDTGSESPVADWSLKLVAKWRAAERGEG